MGGLPAVVPTVFGFCPLLTPFHIHATRRARVARRATLRDKSILDLPATVRLPTSGAVDLLRAAADDGINRVLATWPGRRLVSLGGRHRVPIAGVGVAPRSYRAQTRHERGFSIDEAMVEWLLPLASLAVERRTLAKTHL